MTPDLSPLQRAEHELRELRAQLAAQEQEIARLTRIGEMCGADADRWALKYRDAKSVRDAALAEVARLKGYMSEDDLAAAGLPEGQP